MLHQKKSIKVNNTNTNCSVDVTRNNFVFQSSSGVFNCNEVSNNVLDDEVDIFNVHKTKHNDAIWPIQNIMQNPCQPPVVVVNNSLENQNKICRLKSVPGENLYSNVLKDHNGTENNIANLGGSIANLDRNTKV